MSSKEVATTVGEGADLDEQITELESELSTPSERAIKETKLAALKEQRTTRAATALRGEAETRLLGITRALGSLADQSTLDNARLLKAAQEFADKVAALEERYEKCISLRHEAAALAEVFGLPMPGLPTIVVPALRPDVQGAFEITSRVGVRDNGFIPPIQGYENGISTGRTYEELGDLPGRDLIRRKGARTQ